MSMSHWNTGEDIRADVAIWVICIAIGWFGGWVHGHQTVKSECEKVGAFYVADKTFKCERVTR